MKDKTTIGWLWRIAARRKLYIAVLSVLQMVQGASGVLFALLLRGVVDSAVARSATLLWHYVWLTTALVAGQIALGAVLRALNERCRIAMVNAYKERLLNELLHRDFASVTAVHTGEWLNRLTNDTSVVANSMTELLPGLLGMFVKLISAMVMIVMLEPRFAFLILIGGIVMMIFTYFFRARLKRLHKLVQEADGRLRIFLQERLGSLLVIRSYAAEEQTRQSAEEKLEGHKQARIDKNRFSNLCNIGFGGAMSGMYLLGYFWCAFGILRHTMTFGTLTAITQLIGQVQSPFANLTGIIPRYYAMIASAERLREVESLPAGDADDRRDEQVQEYYKEIFSSVEMENVSYAYYPQTEMVQKLEKTSMPSALCNASLIIRKGEIVALTGQSGCGKSTALKLLMGVYRPDNGRVILRDTQGSTETVSGSWRRLFAYVPQGNVLMSGTIREAVTFADQRRKDDDEAIWDAIRIACAEEFVLELENGTDTFLGERGAGLSEGQLQRLAVARAVFSGRPVMLLDEATSALDAETEKRLLENLRSMTDRTVVIITHRPAALAMCDRVLRFSEEGISTV